MHLIGATSHIISNLDRAVNAGDLATTPVQRGGEYNDIPELRSAADAAERLIAQLDQIARSVLQLDDDALRRQVTVRDGDGRATGDVPIGLVLRHAFTEHFDEHMVQLRSVLSLIHELTPLGQPAIIAP